MSTNIQRDQFRFLQAMEVQTFPYQRISELSKVDQQRLHHALVLCEKLIHEEAVTELLPALRNFQLTPSDAHLVELYDGCVDTVYVIMQLMNTLGLDFQIGWNEVHRSNMAKRTDGKILKSPGGKVLKPAGWTPPDLAKIISDGYSEGADAQGHSSYGGSDS